MIPELSDIQISDFKLCLTERQWLFLMEHSEWDYFSKDELNASKKHKNGFITKAGFGECYLILSFPVPEIEPDTYIKFKKLQSN